MKKTVQTHAVIYLKPKGLPNFVLQVYIPTNKIKKESKPKIIH